MKKIRKNREYGDTGKSLKHKKVCKFTKGYHDFELIYPSDRIKYNVTPEEYYLKRKEEIIREGGFWLNWGVISLL